jgi:multidrug efflux pump
MLGETTLAMLYVPLLFYLFDRLKEKGEGKTEGPGAATEASTASAPESPPMPAPKAEGD